MGIEICTALKKGDALSRSKTGSCAKLVQAHLPDKLRRVAEEAERF